MTIHVLQVFPVHPPCPTGLAVAGPKMAPEAEGAMRGRWGAGLEVKGRSREGGKGHTATTEASPCPAVTVMLTRLTTVPALLAYQCPVQRLALAADPDLEEGQGEEEEGVITTTTIAAPGVTTLPVFLSVFYFISTANGLYPCPLGCRQKIKFFPGLLF